MSSPPRRVLRVALDWTPNTNHVGFFIAAERGWYGEAGLDVQLLSPHVDGYKTTPAAHLANGSADLACVPSESVISAATWPTSHGVREKPALVAVAALLQQDASAVVALQSSGITRPRELDGKRYASYAARYEGRLVQSLIRADGGSGSFIELTPPMLDIWPMLLAGQADATWVSSLQQQKYSA
jgi:ABC-type nitrate/sulfonate/bicarbonate transport system substrate-binding protein